MSAPASSAAPRPLIGIFAVLIGAFISTLNGRLSSFGLADIRGALGLGIDEAAWITTAQTVAQMLVGPVAVWATTVFGTRQVLLGGCTVFAAASALIPFSGGIHAILALQFLAGLGSGCFVPVTITFVLRSLSPKWWALGIAVYALNLETSLNVSASLEGWYVDHTSLAWIFWQNVPLALAMALCVRLGIPDQPFNRLALQRADWFGMATIAVGLALIYAALDQGNRLDWLSSGLVVGLFVAGGALVLTFILHEATTPHPWINLALLRGGYLPLLLMLVAEVRLASLGTAYLVPQYLIAVRGFRAPEVGDVLIWVAIPQLVAAPLAAILLRTVDPRWVASTGLLLIGGACFGIADGLTTQWSADQFLFGQLVQALGQTLAISAAIFVGALHLRPADAPTFGAMLQVARLFGGELGLALVVTVVRKSEQVASNLIGDHVVAGSVATLGRLQAGAAALATHSASGSETVARSTALLAQSVRTQANLQSFIDGFQFIAASTVFALALLLFLTRHPPGPAAPSFRQLRLRRAA